MKKFIFLLLTIIFSSTLLSTAESRVTVPLEDSVYRQLDKLVAHGLIKTRVLGQRPYTRSEIIALIKEALKNYPQFENQYRRKDLSLKKSSQQLLTKVYVDKILARLQQQYPELLEETQDFWIFKPLEELSFAFTYLDQNPSRLLADNGLGGLNAEFQSLTSYREGRRYQKGSNFAFESQHWLQGGDFLGLQVQPRFQMQVPRSPFEEENKAYLQRASLNLAFYNLQLQMGRDAVHWGPGAWGGLILSSQGRALDHVLLSSDRPFRLPGALKKLGHFKLSFLAANLGPEREFPYAWLLGYRISHLPSPHFEWGMSHLTILGGEHGPDLSAGRFFREFFTFQDSEKYANPSFSFDFRGSIPQLHRLEVYGEIHFEDLGPNLAATFTKNASYLFGVYAPRLNYSGTWDGRLEFVKTGARYGRHQVFTEGMTLNQKMLGAAMGPDAWSLRLQFFHDLSPHNLFEFSFEYLRQNQSQYLLGEDSIDTAGQVGHQDRFIYQWAWRHYVNPHLLATSRLAIETVHGTQVAKEDTFNWMGEIMLTYFFSSQLVDKRAVKVPY